MSLDRALGVLGLIVGLPGFFALFFTNQGTAASLAIALAIVLIGAGVLVERAVNQPAFRCKEVKLSVTVDPKVSVLKKTYRMVPNFNNLRDFMHRNIAADGRIHTFLWNGKPVDSNHISKQLGEYSITTPLVPPPSKGKEFGGELSYTMEDAFPDSTESMIYAVDIPTEIVSMTLQLARPCTTAEARIEASGQSRELPGKGLIISEDRKTLTLEAKRPRVGSWVRIYWNW